MSADQPPETKIPAVVMGTRVSAAEQQASPGVEAEAIGAAIAEKQSNLPHWFHLNFPDPVQTHHTHSPSAVPSRKA